MGIGVKVAQEEGRKAEGDGLEGLLVMYTRSCELVCRDVCVGNLEALLIDTKRKRRFSRSPQVATWRQGRGRTSVE